MHDARPSSAYIRTPGTLDPAERRPIERPPFRAAAAVCHLGQTEAETSSFHEELRAGPLGRQNCMHAAVSLSCVEARAKVIVSSVKRSSDCECMRTRARTFRIRLAFGDCGGLPRSPTSLFVVHDEDDGRRQPADAVVAPCCLHTECLLMQNACGSNNCSHIYSFFRLSKRACRGAISISHERKDVLATLTTVPNLRLGERLFFFSFLVLPHTFDTRLFNRHTLVQIRRLKRAS